MGFFDNKNDWIKCAGNPMDLLATDDFNNWLALPDRKWVVGHNRYSTRGAATTENAHPFIYGDIIGCHNGVITAPDNYDVDSEYLFDLLNVAENDYQAALDDVGGYWGLAWSYKGELYLQAHNNKIALARIGEAYCFSSATNHLEACIGKYDELIILENGATIKFDKDNKLVILTAFTSKIPKYETKTYKSRKNKYTSYDLGYYDDDKWWNKPLDHPDNSEHIQCAECFTWVSSDKITEHKGIAMCNDCLEFATAYPEYYEHCKTSADDIPLGIHCDRCKEYLAEKGMAYHNGEALCERCLSDAIDLQYSKF